MGIAPLEQAYFLLRKKRRGAFLIIVKHFWELGEAQVKYLPDKHETH